MSEFFIDVVSDAVCPWCFVGKRRLEAALTESDAADVRVRWRPFQLDATIPAEGLDRKTYMNAKFRDPARLAEAHARLKALGAEVGIAFDFADTGLHITLVNLLQVAERAFLPTVLLF